MATPRRSSPPTGAASPGWQTLSSAPPISIIGISGSTRRGSFNSALLRAAASSMPQGGELRIESIASIPLYNGDEEAARGIPEAVAIAGASPGENVRSFVAGFVAYVSARKRP